VSDNSNERPVRRLAIPEDCILTDDEIVRALQVLNERKAQGDAGFALVESLEPEFYTLKVPVKAAISREDIIISLNKLNVAIEYGFADVTFVIQDGRMVKKGWITLRDNQGRGGVRIGDGRAVLGLSVGGRRTPEF
jgi:hypothetical protein